MASRQLNRYAWPVVALLGVAVGVTALLLLGRYAPTLADFNRRHVFILAINAVAAFVLLVVLVANLVRLARDYRQRIPGSRIRARLVAVFAGLCLVPLLVVYFFALQVLNGGIDSWFDTDLDQQLSSSLRLSREALDVQATSRLRQTSGIAGALGDLRGNALERALDVLRVDAGADELTVFGPGLRIEGSSTREARLPPSLPEETWVELRRSQRFVALEPEGNARYVIRAAATIGGDRTDAGERYLQALYSVGDRQGRLADSVQDTYNRYSELRYLRQPLKYSLVLTLSLVLLLSLLAAAGGAFYFARRLSSPIESLVAGTEAVAKGDLDVRLPAGASDEVGFLIQSFNDMVGRLSRAREESRRSQQQLENERANLAAILARLSTGVIAIGPDRRLRIANDAALRILGIDVASGAALDDAVAGSPLFAQFIDACRQHVPEEGNEWRDQVVLRTEVGRRILNCASSLLPPDATDAGGTIIVFDDVTELLSAQRDAAWGEVARRLAHEIKNPLTPIRLAAERIRRKYLPTLDADESQVLDRSTHTIVQQVEAMRDMVNAFSEYARAPAINLAPVRLDQLIREVAWLYRAQEGQPAVILDLQEGLELEADAVRVRQLLHNLIRNALEALDGQAEGRIEIVARHVTSAERGWAEVVVTDNGPGIPQEVLSRLFEPYVTSKKKGTGLGLAIVRKLVEEHGGSIAVDNLQDRGARIVIRLPERATGREGSGEHRSSGMEPRAEQRRERA